MSKTDVREIDVRRGDTWTAHPSEFRLLQHRDGKNREIASLGYSRWHDHCASWESIPSWMAMDAIGRLGYTITRNDGKVEGGDEAKPADVPEVDAVWVEDTMADGSKSLTAYSGRESAEACATLDMERGRARIVRLRPDAEAIKAVVREMLENYSATDHNARAMADDATRIVACVNALAGIPDPAAYIKAMREALAVISSMPHSQAISTAAVQAMLDKAINLADAALRTLTESEAKPCP